MNKKQIAVRRLDCARDQSVQLHERLRAAGPIDCCA